MKRDDARPKLKIVNDALAELYDLVMHDTEILSLGFKKKWNDILNLYDINYNDLNRWEE